MTQHNLSCQLFATTIKIFCTGGGRLKKTSLNISCPDNMLFSGYSVSFLGDGRGVKKQNLT